MTVSSCASSVVATTKGSPAHPSAAPFHVASVDPCALVTAGDASAAAGKELVNAVYIGGAPIAGACVYDTHDNSSAVIVYAQVYPDAATAEAVTPQQVQSATGSLLADDSNDAVAVKGIGDRAAEFSYKRAGQGVAIIVYRANVVFVIGADPASDSTAVENLAKTAVTRLG